MNKIIELKNLTYDYVHTAYDAATDKTIRKKSRGVRDIDLSIEEGEFVAIVGRNGSGKSTLSKLIIGLLETSEGEIIIDGCPIKGASDIIRARKKVAMVFQNPDNQLVAGVVEDDVAFGPENLGIPSDEIRKRVDRALNDVGMSAFKEKMVYNLSGGQKQRVAIAGALASEPKAIIFDEATSMLDPKGRRKILEIAKQLNSQGMTIIMITHFMQEALLADRIIALDSGSVALDTKANEFFKDIDKIKELGLWLPFDIELQLRLGLDIEDAKRDIHAVLGEYFS